MEEKQTQTQFRCDVCGAVFKDRDALTKHKRIHESDRGNKGLEQGTRPPTENPTLPPNVAPITGEM